MPPWIPPRPAWIRESPSLRAPAAAPLTLQANTFGSDFDTVLAVYEGEEIGSLTEVDCNDDAEGSQSELSFSAEREDLDDHKVIEETLEQCILADEMGFDYIWLVEHHFLTGFSASSCPEVFYGALSRLTKQIRFGIGVVILPYHNPVRVAERVAFLDHLSHGRVDMGTGRSAVYEQTGMGLDPRLTREMWEESLTMIPKIWESDYFEWEGRFWSVAPRQVLPKPYQNLILPSG